MHVLLTGGGGFIGSHLTDALIGDGHHVTVIDNFCSGRKQNLAHLAAHDRFTLLEQDVMDPIEI